AHWLLDPGGPPGASKRNVVAERLRPLSPRVAIAIGSLDSPAETRRCLAMKVRIHVSLKPGVLDPQGRAVHHALEGLGFDGIRDVRMGRLIELDVTDDTSDAQLDEMCRKLLANMVIENYRIEKVEAKEPAQ